MSRFWKKEEDELLRKLYPDNDTNEIVKYFDRSLSGLHNRAYTLGLRKSLKFKQNEAKRLEESGKANRFKKGNKSWNKGTKGLTSSNRTSFKKGHKPHNHRSVGTEVVTFDGYIKVKIAEPRTWELKHRLQWEKHNGPIPEGYNVQFRNGDRKDCRIENLYLIDKAGNMEKNTIQRYPDDIKNVLRRNAKLKRVIKKMETQENE